MKKNKLKVFLSYSRKDSELAHEIRRHLHNAGFDCFIDEAGIRGGEAFADVLDEKIKSADTVLALWSKESLSRPWVRIECDIAREREVLVPIAIEDIERLEIPANLWGIHYLRIDPEDIFLDLSWRQIVASIEDRIGQDESSLKLSHEAIENVSPSSGEGKNLREIEILVNRNKEILCKQGFNYDLYKKRLATNQEDFSKEIIKNVRMNADQFGSPEDKQHAFALNTLLLEGSLEKNEVSQYFRDVDGGPTMRTIAPGTFQMGADLHDFEAYENEKPQHMVKIEKSFAIAITPVTFSEYDVFCGQQNYNRPQDEGWGRNKKPVVNVSWNNAVAYTAWLSEITGLSYRLPSEAEWEYAARAGTEDRYLGYDGDPTDIGNCDEMLGSTSNVGMYAPNPWGLFDMLGNVWEWVLDCWEPYYSSSRNSSAPYSNDSISVRCLRGGSWDCRVRHMRVTDRCRQGVENKINNVGFRVVRDL